MGQIAK